MENQNALAVQQQAGGLEAVFGSIGASFFSGSAKTPEEKKLLANAMNNPDKRLADCINQEIAIKDLYVEQVDMVKETGEVQICPRIVLIDKDGVSYGCVSFGILGSLKKIMSVYGVPTWDEPVTVKPVFITKGNDRRILSLLLV